MKKSKKYEQSGSRKRPHAIDLLARIVAVIGLLFAGITLALNYGDYLEARKKPQVTKTEIYSNASFIEDIGTIPGNCWTTSSTSFRIDAFRCSTDNLLRDPCFIDFDSYSLESGQSTFYCPDGPTKSKNDVSIISNIPDGRRFVDTASESNFENLKNKLPWFIEFNKYGSCRFSSGAGSTAFDGINVNYICEGDLVVANEIREINGNSFFRCKRIHETTFQDCQADLIVY